MASSNAVARSIWKYHWKQFTLSLTTSRRSLQSSLDLNTDSVSCIRHLVRLACGWLRRTSHHGDSLLDLQIRFDRDRVIVSPLCLACFVRVSFLLDSRAWSFRFCTGKYHGFRAWLACTCCPGFAAQVLVTRYLCCFNLHPKQNNLKLKSKAPGPSESDKNALSGFGMGSQYSRQPRATPFHFWEQR